MKSGYLCLAAALVLAFGMAPPAQALSVGNSEFANTDGSSKFSDPDDQYTQSMSSGLQAVVPFASGPAIIWNPAHVAPVTTPASPPCAGADCKTK
jgi:hypothetical protein